MEGTGAIRSLLFEPMHPLSVDLRLMTEGDVDFADGLRASVGWNQTRSDWLRFLAAAPDGCFVAELEGVPVGTATTIRYGRDLAWIGMVLVRPEYRRRGVGRALLGRCLQALQSAEVRRVRLDATPLGRPVYERLGFRAEFDLTRWERAGSSLTGQRGFQDPPHRWSRWGAGHSQWVGTLDRRAFGAWRGDFLTLLGAASECGWVVSDADGQCAGYGLMRAGARARYLGPVVAADPRVGLLLVQALLAEAGGGSVFWDLPGFHADLARWAEAQGFRPQRTLTRMALDFGDVSEAAEPAWQIAITGPETG